MDTEQGQLRTGNGTRADAVIGMRSDLVSMLMPFFPEDKGHTKFEACIGGYTIAMYCDRADTSLATSADRKLLNLLAGAVAHHIRAGHPPSRHVVIDTRTIVETLSGDTVTGGSEYQRIVERLERLMATVIETEMPLGDDVARRRRFRWIDAFEHDDQQTAGGRKMLRLKISISEDAFLWMTRSLGYDINRERFHAITTTRASFWRIYEICLAHLMNNGGVSARLGLDDLRRRVPISSELKVFKARTLRSAFAAIEEHTEMSGHLRLSLERQTGPNSFETIDFTKRARLDSLYVGIHRGSRDLPDLNRILPAPKADSIHQHELNLDPSGGDLMAN